MGDGNVSVDLSRSSEEDYCVVETSSRRRRTKSENDRWPETTARKTAEEVVVVEVPR